MMDNVVYGREGLKDNVEKEARKEETAEQREDNIDLTAREIERALKETYRSYRTPKKGVDSHVDRAKPHIKTLLEDQLKEMQSSKVIKTLWGNWRKPVQLVITLDPEDIESAQHVVGNTGDNYTKVEMPYNSLMAEFFESINTDELLQRVFAHIKT